MKYCCKYNQSHGTDELFNMMTFVDAENEIAAAKLISDSWPDATNIRVSVIPGPIV